MLDYQDGIEELSDDAATAAPPTAELRMRLEAFGVRRNLWRARIQIL